MTAPKPTPPISVNWLPWVIIAVFAVVFFFAWRAEVARSAVADEELKVTQRQLDSLAKIAPKVQIQYVHDTIVLSRVLTKYTTLHDTVLRHLTDTVEVKQYIAVADSTIHACTAVVADCAKRHTIDSAQAAAWQRMYQAERAKQPSVIVDVGEKVLIGLAGLAVGRLVK